MLHDLYELYTLVCLAINGVSSKNSARTSEKTPTFTFMPCNAKFDSNSFPFLGRYCTYAKEDTLFNRSSVKFSSFYCFALHVLGSVPMRKCSAIDWTGPNGACFSPCVPIRSPNLIQISPKCHTSCKFNNLVEGHVTKIWNSWRLCTYIMMDILDIIHYPDSYFMSILYYKDFTLLPSSDRKTTFFWPQQRMLFIWQIR
jgi:hypothetical protein